MASNIQSDIIWRQFPETKIRQRKFRLWLQISKKNRGEGQKTDHKRIFVIRSQLGETDMSSTDGKEQRNLFFLPRKWGPKFPGLARSHWWKKGAVSWVSPISPPDQRDAKPWPRSA